MTSRNKLINNIYSIIFFMIAFTIAIYHKEIWYYVNFMNINIGNTLGFLIVIGLVLLFYTLAGIFMLKK